MESAHCKGVCIQPGASRNVASDVDVTLQVSTRAVHSCNTHQSLLSSDSVDGAPRRQRASCCVSAMAEPLLVATVAATLVPTNNEKLVFDIAFARRVVRYHTFFCGARHETRSGIKPYPPGHRSQHRHGRTLQGRTDLKRMCSSPLQPHTGGTRTKSTDAHSTAQHSTQHTALQRGHHHLHRRLP